MDKLYKFDEEVYKHFYELLFNDKSPIIENCYNYNKFSTKSEALFSKNGEITGKKFIVTSSIYAIVDIDIHKETPEDERKNIEEFILSVTKDLNVFVIKTSGCGYHIYTKADKEFTTNNFKVSNNKFFTSQFYDIDIFLPIGPLGKVHERDSQQKESLIKTIDETNDQNKSLPKDKRGIMLPGSYAYSSHNLSPDIPGSYTIIQESKKNISLLSELWFPWFEDETGKKLSDLAEIKSHDIITEEKKNTPIILQKNNLNLNSYILDKNFLFSKILPCFDNSITIHNDSNPRNKEVSIFPLVSALNSWLEEDLLGKGPKNITKDDIYSFMLHVKNNCILTDNAKKNFDYRIKRDIENGIRSHSKFTIIDIIRIHNEEKYNSMILPYLKEHYNKRIITNDHKLFYQISNTIKKSNYEREEIIKIFSYFIDKIDFKELSTELLSIINEINYENWITNLFDRTQTLKSILSIIRSKEPTFEIDEMFNLYKFPRINLVDNFSSADIKLSNYLKVPSDYSDKNIEIDNHKLGLDLRKIIGKDSESSDFCYKYKNKIEFLNRLQLKENLNSEILILNNKKIKLGDYLCDNIQIFKDYLNYNKIVFNSEDNDNISIFTGFNFKEFIPTNDQIEKVKIFFDHMKNIISNNSEEVYNYIFSWISFIIQNPGRKTKTCILINGSPGSGKSIFLEIISKIFGEYCIPSCTSLNAITGEFNGILENKMLVICNELCSEEEGKKFVNIDILKELITGEDIVINEKNKPRRVASQVANFMFSSNYKSSIPIPENDRRFVILKTNDKYTIKDEEKIDIKKHKTKQIESNNYFSKLAIMKEHDNLEIIYNIFRSHDISSYIPSNIIDTEEKRNIINIQIDTYKSYIVDNLKTFTTKTIRRCNIQEHFKNWCDREKRKYKISLFQSFIKDELEVTRTRTNGEDIKYYVIKESKKEYYLELFKQIYGYEFKDIDD